MNDYVIINGVNSNTISGLKISKLPPITKPQMRTLIETIDGRDGDLITDLGYSAYDKQLEIGLWGTYDINTIISFFNQEGTITFSNEADKFYNFKIINQIDYQKLLKFKTAVVVMHCQPFKYPTNETPIEGTPTTITGEGESLTLNNTLEAPMEIDLKGNTYQYSTTGKNKLSPIANASASDNGITLTNNNGVYKLNGSTPSSGGSNITRSLSSNYTIQSGDYLHIGNSVANSSVSIGLLNNGTQVSAPSFSEVNRIVNLSDKAGQTINQLRIYTTKNQSVNMDIKPMICNSSGTTEFEYFTGGTASPNPDYPQNIQVVSGDNSIKVEGKNLCFNTTKPANANLKFFIDKPAQTFTISFTTNEALNSNSLYLEVDGTGYGNLGGITASANTRVEKTYTLSNENYQAILNGTNIDLLLYKNGANFTIPTDAMVENNNQATSYEPYQSQTYPISLGDIELCKIGEYQDRIYKDSGKWYLHKEIGKTVITSFNSKSGTSNNYMYSTTSISNIKRPGGGTVVSSILATHGISKSPNTMYLNNTTGVGVNTDGTIAVAFSLSSTLTTKELANQWVENNNITTYYRLDTPTDTEITDNTLISQLNALEGANSYDNQTNVSQTNNDYPFWLCASTTFNAPITINNIGNIYAKPILELEGSGNITINLNSQDILAISLGETTTKIVIDIPNLEAYNPTDSTLMNRLVVGDYMKFLINSGNNTLKIDGTITSYRLTSYTRWL